MGVSAVGSAHGVVQQGGGGSGSGGDPSQEPGRDDASRGAAALGGGGSLEQAVQQLTSAVAALSTALGAGPGTGVGGVSGGGPAASTGCGCDSGGGGGSAGALAAPEAPTGDSPKQESKDKDKDKDKEKDKGAKQGGGANGAPSQYAAPKGASSSPDVLPGETSHNGLQDKAKQVLSAAHAAGLKLISGSRPGDDGGHGNGTAVDISNVKGGSKQGSPEMEQFAEAMRAAGKAGDPTVGYVIYRQRIASSRDNWAWRDMEDRGSNTQNHFDHVHVSTDPNL